MQLLIQRRLLGQQLLLVNHAHRASRVTSQCDRRLPAVARQHDRLLARRAGAGVTPLFAGMTAGPVAAALQKAGLALRTCLASWALSCTCVTGNQVHDVWLQMGDVARALRAVFRGLSSGITAGSKARRPGLVTPLRHIMSLRCLGSHSTLWSAGGFALRTDARCCVALSGACVDARREVAPARQPPPAGSAARPRGRLAAAQPHGLVATRAGHADECAARRAGPLRRRALQECGCPVRGLHI